MTTTLATLSWLKDAVASIEDGTFYFHWIVNQVKAQQKRCLNFLRHAVAMLPKRF